ncbi:MAG: Uncharacterised protein [Flavobacterium sp. SCGC AAA160-P02]|nr:MAG: Uncharacterised protein [Flavobacterium sp. SCGC AAA160-P02]
MKTKLFFLFSLLSFCLSSQNTYDLTWANDGSDDNQQITIEIGDTVRWTWGSGTHNLRATSGTESFNSGYHAGPGYVFSYTFNQVGSTNYVCDPHAGNMNGTVTVTSTAGVTENKVLRFDIYPNPALDELSIQLPQGMNKATVSVFDYLGRLIKTQSLSSDNAKLDVSFLSSGLYLISINADGKIGTQRFIKK